MKRASYDLQAQFGMCLSTAPGRRAASERLQPWVMRRSSGFRIAAPTHPRLAEIDELKDLDRRDRSERTLPRSVSEGACSSVAQNDIVVLAGRLGTWKVEAPVNGSKADLRKRESFDTRIVTALVEHLTVIRRAGSPGCDY